MSSIIVTTVDVHPPVVFVGKNSTDIYSQLNDWAKKEWAEIFEIPCPEDPDVVLKRVLNARNAELRSELKTLQ